MKITMNYEQIHNFLRLINIVFHNVPFLSFFNDCMQKGNYEFKRINKTIFLTYWEYSKTHLDRIRKLKHKLIWNTQTNKFNLKFNLKTPSYIDLQGIVSHDNTRYIKIFNISEKEHTFLKNKLIKFAKDSFKVHKEILNINIQFTMYNNSFNLLLNELTIIQFQNVKTKRNFYFKINFEQPTFFYSIDTRNEIIFPDENHSKIIKLNCTLLNLKDDLFKN